MRHFLFGRLAPSRSPAAKRLAAFGRCVVPWACYASGMVRLLVSLYTGSRPTPERAPDWRHVLPEGWRHTEPNALGYFRAKPPGGRWAYGRIEGDELTVWARP